MIDWLNNHPTLESALIVLFFVGVVAFIAYIGWPSECDLDDDDWWI